MSGVSDIYLRAAHEAGLTAEVAGHRYIAGEYSDPITGSNRCLVEYCDPAGIQSEVFPRWKQLWSERRPGRPYRHHGVCTPLTFGIRGLTRRFRCRE
jgi:hypothetical protein